MHLGMQCSVRTTFVGPAAAAVVKRPAIGDQLCFFQSRKKMLFNGIDTSLLHSEPCIVGADICDVQCHMPLAVFGHVKRTRGSLFSALHF